MESSLCKFHWMCIFRYIHCLICKINCWMRWKKKHLSFQHLCFTDRIPNFLDRIVNQQLTLIKRSMAAHFELNFSMPHSVYISCWRAIWCTGRLYQIFSLFFLPTALDSISNNSHRSHHTGFHLKWNLCLSMIFHSMCKNATSPVRANYWMTWAEQQK